MSLRDSDEVLSDEEELQEAFARGDLKPGLNVVVETKKSINKVHLLKNKYDNIYLKLPWLERLDLVNTPAPLAPELALQMQEQEQRRAKQLKGNKKLPQYAPSEDPVLNDFRRETMFHRQAQSAVMEGIAKLKQLKIKSIIRPDDYFAEMAKSDEHMQKVRENLVKKQMEVQRSEKVRQLRLQRKVGKQMQIEATLKKHEEKRKILQEVKKFKKGKRSDLDFLDDKKPFKNNKTGGNKERPGLSKKAAMKNKKFGFGGKKRGIKKNTKDSAADVSDYRKPLKPGMKKRNMKSRPGKNRRIQMKANRK